MKRLTVLIMIAVFGIFNIVEAAENPQNFSVTINGKAVEFENQLFIEDETLYFPLNELFAKIGFYIEWNKEKQAFEGNDINRAMIAVPADSETACYDNVWMELDHPTKRVKKEVYVPKEFIDDIYDLDIVVKDRLVDIAVKVKGFGVKDTETVDAKIEKFLNKKPVSENILPEENLDYFLDMGTTDTARIELVDVTGQSFSRVVEIENFKKPELYWTYQITQPSKLNVSKGDIIILTFYARKLMSTDESGYGSVDICFEEMGGMWKKSIMEEIKNVSGDWQKFSFVFEAAMDMKAEKAQFGLRYGYKNQIIQVGGIELKNYRKQAEIGEFVAKPEDLSYREHDDNALWRREALKRIEKYRKSDFRVEVKDENGNPVPDAKVNAEMLTSEFMYGVAHPASLRVKTRIYDENGDPSNWSKFTFDNFNTFVASEDMKAGSYDPTRANWAVQMAQDNNMRYRGHALLWDAGADYYPASWGDLSQKTEEEIEELLKEHISELTGYFQYVDYWDVVNEPTNSYYLRERFGISTYADVFKIAKKLNPNAKLYVNEACLYGNDARYNEWFQFADIIKRLKAEGAPIDGIGIESHNVVSNFQKWYNNIDILSEFVDEFTVTEFDTATGTPEYQGKNLRDLLILAYSHPKINGFVMWGFSDTYSWINTGTLLDMEHNAKPGLKYWNELVNHEWKTKVNGSCDKNGVYSERGHKGEYIVTVEVEGKKAETKLKITKDGENTVRAIVTKDGISLEASEQNVEKPRQTYEPKRLEYMRDYYKGLADVTKNLIAEAVSDGNVQENCVLDENMKTFWTDNKQNSYLTLKLDGLHKQGYLYLGWQNPSENTYHYRVEISVDGQDWETVKTGKATDNDVIEFKDKDIQQIRISKNSSKDIAVSEVYFADNIYDVEHLKFRGNE